MRNDMAIEKEQPIQPELRALMNDIGDAIGGALTNHTKHCGEKYGFCLMMFALGEGEGHRMNYIANVEREDMLAAMKEFIARNEGRYEEINPAKKRQ